MKPETVDGLFDELCEQAGLGHETRREPVRAWVLSGVERLHLVDGSTLFFKHAAAPFTAEARVLRHVAGHGVPSPGVIAAVEHPEALGMLLEDLGPQTRPATVQEAAEAAVAAHAVPPLDGAALLDEAGLAALPAECLNRVEQLRTVGRWPRASRSGADLHRLAVAAATRAESAELAPFGLCHSEFHPTSLHVTGHGWRLLDWARAFHGPGLLDLASWQGTTQAPDLARFDLLLDAYLTAGGPTEAAASRGGLTPARWAFGWHRLWIVNWYLQQATTWIADPAQDPLYQRVIARHLTEAVACLSPE